MTISTYAELQTAVANWLGRANLTDRIPEFISIGEARINREVNARVQQLRTTTTASTYINLPTDFREMRAIWITASGRIYKLQYLTPDALLTLYSSTTAGTPKHFTIIGDEVRFGPPADSSYTVELWYYKDLASLSSAVNALFTVNPDLYLYAALCAAIPFIKDDKRITVWEAQYQMVRNQVNEGEEDAIRTSDMQILVA